MSIPGRTDPAAVHVAGPVFRDGLGRQLLFRGYNAKINGIFDATFDDGRTPNEVFPDFDETSATKLEELGFDVIRLTINWSALEPHPMQYSPTFFSKVDAVLDMAHRHHFYVILDMHQDAYSKEIGEDGAPLWAIAPPPAQLLSGPSNDSRRTSAEVLAAGFNFFANALATDGRPLPTFIAAVATMARRYRRSSSDSKRSTARRPSPRPARRVPRGFADAITSSTKTRPLVRARRDAQSIRSS